MLYYQPLFLKPKLIRSPIITINIHSNFPDLLKKGYASFHKLSLHSTDTSINPQSQWSISQIEHIRRNLLTLSRRIKHVQNLDLGKFPLKYCAYFRPTMTLFAKRISNTRHLSLHDNKCFKEKYKSLVDIWPRYVKRIHALHYTITTDFRAPKLADNMTPLYIYLRYQNRLQTFHFTFPESPLKSLENNLLLHKYPKSLRLLVFHQGIFEEPLQTLSPSQIPKNLKGLGLNFHLECSAAFLSSVLFIASQISELQILSLSLPRMGLIDWDLHLQPLQNLCRLKKLSLISSFIKLNNFESFILKTLPYFPLTYLKLFIPINSDKQLLPIINLLQHLSKLQTLKLRIHNFQPFHSTDFLQKIFQIIDNLPLLQSLNISFKTCELGETKNHLFRPEFSRFDSKLFTKETPIKSFKLECKQLSLSNQDLFELFSSMEWVALSLKKLRINIGSQDMQDFTLDFIRKLLNIQVLQLPCLNISCRWIFQGFVEEILKLKYLRDLVIGEIKIERLELKFTEGIGKILGKYGLRRFNCDAPKVKQIDEKRVKNYLKISMREVMRKNPHLVHRPNLPIYKN